MARPTTLTPAIAQAVVTAVKAGATVVTAAQYAGIAKATVLAWLQRGEGTHRSRGQTKLYVDFVDAIRKAQAEDEIRRLARIEQAGRGGAVLSEKTLTYRDGRVLVERHYAQPAWQADAWYLERTRPDQYGRRDRMSVQLSIEQVARQVALETGEEVQAILAEATRLLEKADEDPRSAFEQ